MGYILQIHAADLDAITDQLTHPTLTIDDLDATTRDLLSEEAIANLDLLATTLADAVADGGGTPEGALVDYLLAVIAHHGHLYATLQHSSAGGDAFRDDLIAGSVADLIGRQPAAHLLDRPLVGLVGDGYPTWGHLTSREVASIANRDLAVNPSHPDATELHDLTAAIQRAAHFELGIATIYA